MPQNHSRVARFGVFEIDLSAGELRKNGVKQRLQGQPFQVLTVLLERAGEVVTREELQQKLWPSDTFVDFDHSLNTAINKVREAFGRLGLQSSLRGDIGTARISLHRPRANGCSGAQA